MARPGFLRRADFFGLRACFFFPRIIFFLDAGFFFAAGFFLRAFFFLAMGNASLSFRNFGDNTPPRLVVDRKIQRPLAAAGLIQIDLADVFVDYEDAQIIAVLFKREHEETEFLWIVAFRRSG